MPRTRRQKLMQRGRTTGLPPIVIILSVLAILAGSVIVTAEVNPYPPVTQGLHDAVMGVQASGLASTLVVTDPSGNKIYTGTTLTRFAYLELPSGGTLFNSTTGASGQVQDTLTAAITIQSGTPTNYTISGQQQVVVDGKQAAQVPISVAKSGAPPAGAISLASTTRTGQQLWSDFGGKAPSASTPHTVSFATTGSVTVCFTEGSCVTKTWSSPSIAALQVSAVPEGGVFTVSVLSTGSTGVTGACKGLCGTTTATQTVGTGTATATNTATSNPPYTNTATSTGSQGGSVVGSTLVLMADGSQEPISQVKPGDRLLAFDYGSIMDPSATYDQAPSTVLAVKVVPADVLYTFMTQTGSVASDGAQPFFTSRGWVQASAVRAGDSLFDPVSRTWTGITGISVSHTSALVYDLELSGFKSYSAGGVLANDLKPSPFNLSGFVFCAGTVVC